MKKADIETGTVYAFARGSYSGYAPTLVLDTERMWERRYLREGPVFATRSAKTPGRLRGYDSIEWGFLAVKAPAWYVGEDDTDGPEQLTTWLAMVEDPHHLTPESIAAMRKSLPKGLELVVINNRHLIGEWSAVVEDAEAADAAARAAIDAERAARARLVSIHEDCGVVWRTRFGDDRTYAYDVYRDSVSMPIATLAALLGVDIPADQ